MTDQSIENIERNIQQQLTEITELINKLHLTPTHDTICTVIPKDHKEEIIIGYESDQEIHMEKDEKPESSKAQELKLKGQLIGDKRKKEFQPTNYSWIPDDNKDNFLNQQGYYYKGTKIRKYPHEYKPKLSKLGADGILNLDCTTNAEDLFIEWNAKLLLLLQVEKPFGDQSDNKDSLWNFVLFKTSGNVRNFLLENAQALQNTPHYLQQIQDVDTFEIISDEIYKEFFGKDIIFHKADIDNSNRLKALRHLNNIHLCDIYYLDSFICEFQKHYYKLPRIEQEMYTHVFIQKLPYPFNVKVQQQFHDKIEKHQVAHNLGGAILITRDLLIDYCLESKLKQTLKHQHLAICCEQNADVPQQYGCEKTYHKHSNRTPFHPKHKYRKNYSRKYRWKKYKPQKHQAKTFPKYFRRYKFKPKYNPKYKTRQKYCPQKKKDCKCWICNEIGHYANECPKKKDKQYNNKVNILHSALANQLEPIESDYSTDITLYLYESEQSSDESTLQNSESNTEFQFNIYSSTSSDNEN